MASQIQNDLSAKTHMRKVKTGPIYRDLKITKELTGDKIKHVCAQTHSSGTQQGPQDVNVYIPVMIGTSQGKLAVTAP